MPDKVPRPASKLSEKLERYRLAEATDWQDHFEQTQLLEQKPTEKESEGREGRSLEKSSPPVVAEES
jgi:hypothetical protein